MTKECASVSRAVDQHLSRGRDGVIYFSVTSDGTTGKEWITRLKRQDSRTSEYARQVLSSRDFKPTSGMTTKVAVLRGALFVDSYRSTKEILIEAVERRNLIMPNAEVACLIRVKFTDKEIKAMGLCLIAAMHTPIPNKSLNGKPFLLYAGCGDWLAAYHGYPSNRWSSDSGFAFVVP